VSPYFIHRIPYRERILLFIALSSCGMLLIALAPPSEDAGIGTKMAGVILASTSSGTGESSFLGLTHYYGHVSLAGWGSGTGAAGLVGAGMYVSLTTWWGFSVRQSLLVSACLPVFMFISFFGILPHGPLRHTMRRSKEYEPLAGQDGRLVGDDVENEAEESVATSALLTPEGAVSHAQNKAGDDEVPSFKDNLRRAKSLVVPYMLPLLLVYVSEYTINQGVAPTLLFPLESTPFSQYRSFYPFYGFLYQLGVFVSRSSAPFVRIHKLYVPSLLQIVNLAFLILQALYFFLPSVHVVFIIIFWEGLLGGSTYVNTFARIMEQVPNSEREFSLSAASVSDSAGICIAGFVGILLETGLCNYQAARGRGWCKTIQIHHE
jgi:battenin